MKNLIANTASKITEIANNAIEHTGLYASVKPFKADDATSFIINVVPSINKTHFALATVKATKESYGPTTMSRLNTQSIYTRDNTADFSQIKKALEAIEILATGDTVQAIHNAINALNNTAQSATEKKQARLDRIMSRKNTKLDKAGATQLVEKLIKLAKAGRIDTVRKLYQPAKAKVRIYTADKQFNLSRETLLATFNQRVSLEINFSNTSKEKLINSLVGAWLPHNYDIETTQSTHSIY